MNKIIDKYRSILSNAFKKGFLHLFSANLLIQIFSFASQLFVANILSPADVGRIKIIQTYLSIFSILAGLGFNASTLKLSSNSYISDEERKSIFFSGISLTVISTSIVYIIVLLLNWFEIFSSDELINWLIPIGLFPLISNSIFQVFISYFQSIKLIKLMSNLSISNKLISIFGIVLFTYIWGLKGYYLAFNMSFILIILFAIKYAHVTLDFSRLKDKFKIHKGYALYSTGATFFAEVSAYIDILTLNFFSKDINEIGMYGFALTLTVIYRIFPSSVQQITIPYFTELNINKSKFLSVFKYYNRILHSVVILIYLVSMLIIPLVISYVFNHKYDNSIPYFYFLGLGWSIRMLNQLRSGALFSLGKVNYNLYTSIISTISNVILFIIAIKFYGFMGLAIANVVSGILIYIMTYLFYKKAIEQNLFY